MDKEKKSNKEPDKTSENNSIPEMNLNNKYKTSSILPENKIPNPPSGESKKELDEKKKELEKIKNFIVKKYPFTQSLSILPPQALQLFIEEEEIPKESEKFTHLYMIIPESNFKEIQKIKPEIVKELEKLKQKVWLQIKTPVDIWNNCFDSKFDLTNAIGMSYPLYDKDGFLGALRISEIHKSMVLKKFDKYVVSYVAYGSFIRGKMSPEAEIDIGIIINDTDVKRMPRLELKERLRTMIYQQVSEAAALAGVKNTLHVQTWLLTEFWDAVKDAHPVMFTFIRDGVPLYDRGTFMPWKALLKMGKLKPSSEAIDMFMKSSEKTKEMIDRRLIDAMVDVYYSVLNPSQALVMLYGSPPPTHKETPKLMDEIFVKKEKMLKKSEIKILEDIVKLFKQYEDNPKIKIHGSKIDNLVKQADEYMERLKGLRKEIEKRSHEKTIEDLYQNVIGLLKTITGKNSKETIIKGFEKDFVKKGKFPKKDMNILNKIIKARNDVKKGKLNAHKVDEARKDATLLINDLIEYTQRCDLANLEKNRMIIEYKNPGNKNFQKAEIINTLENTYLFIEGKVKKISNKGKIENATMQEVNKALSENQGEVKLSNKVLEALKKELGEFQILI
ncbi:MAG: hypothetical protein ACOCUU_02665 [Nanoarchaeota archaeon]